MGDGTYLAMLRSRSRPFLAGAGTAPEGWLRRHLPAVNLNKIGQVLN